MYLFFFIWRSDLNFDVEKWWTIGRGGGERCGTGTGTVGTVTFWLVEPPEQ
jgi:hypothetical protein